MRNDGIGLRIFAQDLASDGALPFDVGITLRQLIALLLRNLIRLLVLLLLFEGSAAGVEAVHFVVHGLQASAHGGRHISQHSLD